MQVNKAQNYTISGEILSDIAQYLMKQPYHIAAPVLNTFQSVVDNQPEPEIKEEVNDN